MDMNRIETEKRVVRKMIEIYCKGHGHAESFCPECTALADYVDSHLEHCKFGEAKPFCSKCEVHCYSPEMREQIRAVMRYSGPRMLFHEPGMAVRHMLGR